MVCLNPVTTTFAGQLGVQLKESEKLQTYWPYHWVEVKAIKPRKSKVMQPPSKNW